MLSFCSVSVRISLAGTNLMLEADGGDVVLATDSVSPAQQWILVSRGDDLVALESVQEPGECLDAYGGQADVQMVECNDGWTNQEFVISE